MPAFSVGAYESTERIDEELEAFVLWLLFSAPLVLALSGVAGYLLSRPALRPIRDLETDIERIAPDELGRRLPVTDDPDEIDRVKIQINALFERLEKAQLRNRRFLQEAAHQIRTPLTIVLGETALSLDRGNGAHADGHRGTLQRVRVAAEQMRRRVDELLLLARAEAGEQPLLHDIVELDGLALESADLMRARATALGRQLELTRVDPVTVRGNEQLLREAMLELLENACRYARRNPIRISVIALDQGAAIEVVTPHAPGAAGHEGGSGLGLQIVRWIASAHGGELRVSDDGDARRDTLVLASDPVPAVNAAVDGGAAR
jgi:two-component system heavy metal sensor histidine kinase CusS